MRLSGRKSSSFTRRWTQKPQVVLLGLIGLNVAAFVAQIFLESSQPGFVREYLGLSASGLDAAYAWQFLTAIFLHASPWYFVGHLLVLFSLGRDVESIVGQRHFLYLYLGGAIAGELGHLFFMPASSIVMAASGGVAAIVVAYATILPELELTSVIFRVPHFRLKAKHLTVAAFSIGLAGVIWHRSDAVAHSGYLGGCLAGWVYAHLLGFGRPPVIQRTLQQRRVEAERFHAMSAEQFISEAVDPILEKISREGLPSLTSRERRTLARAQEKIAAKPPAR
ncbi:MAG: rhomboid family intramembrane serine protease [Verrucomicrobiota bacterium]